MESTAFDVLVMPTALITVEALLACWLVATVAGLVVRLETALVRRRDEAARDRAWRRHAAVEPGADASRRGHRGRLAS